MKQDTVEDIRVLESSIDKNIQNANDIIHLLAYLNDDEYDVKLVIVALQSLRRVFTKIVEKNYLRPKYLNASVELNNAVEKYRIWILEKYQTFLESVIDLMDSSDDVCQITAFRIAISFCQLGDYEMKTASRVFDYNLFLKIIAKLLSFPTLSEQLRLCLKNEYFEYTDFKYYSFNSIRYMINRKSLKSEETEQIASQWMEDEERAVERSDFIKMILDDIDMENLVKRSLYVMSLITSPIDETPKIMGIILEKYLSVQQQKLNFSNASMMIFRQQLSESLLQFILIKLHSDFMPYLVNPILLTDFLTDCYNFGGILSVLALSGLFILITDYNVNYPAYFDKLYRMLTPDTFEVKYRQRFLTLLVQSLRSTNLSASTAAAFCKRLCRLAMTGSPSTAIFVIPLVAELITYHSSCYPLIQIDDVVDVYDVIGHRQPLPGIDEDEMETVEKKRSGVGADLEADDSDDSNENEESEEEVEGEVEDGNMAAPVEMRSTSVLSSDLLNRAVKRMEARIKRRHEEVELPEKRPKIEYDFMNLNDVLKNESAFDPFDNTTDDIDQSHATESYLWELHVLLNHYDPNVVDMMKKLKTKLMKVRQQFNNIVNVTYDTEYIKLSGDEGNRYAFANRNKGYLGNNGVMKKMFV